MNRTLLFAFVLLGAAAASCMDPVHSDDVDALGPEVKGVPEGPDHRPGQPCTTCHASAGPGEPEFSVAGTVYARIDSDEPAAGATVTVTDVKGDKRSFGTNYAGNFYVSKKAWDPVYPLSVEVSYEGVTKQMLTKIRRDAGCGLCHQKAGDPNHAPRVYVLP